jgi:two-component system LytT family response regulator
MIKTLIVDDVKANRDSLEILINKFCPSLSLVGKAGNIKRAEELIRQEKPGLVFLDIEMPGGNGFELLENLKEITFEVIFVTAYDKYAVKAFKFCAIDYLLKPINITELKAAINKVTSAEQTISGVDLKAFIENFKNVSSDIEKIAISSHQGLDFVEIADLIRCEADGKYTKCILTNDKSIMSSKNLKEFELTLPKNQFYRIHHSHLVNMSHIKNYVKQEGGYLVMSNDEKIGISQRKKEDFLKQLSKI